MRTFTSWAKEILTLLAAAALGLAVVPAVAAGQDASSQVVSTSSTTGSGGLVHCRARHRAPDHRKGGVGEVKH